MINLRIINRKERRVKVKITQLQMRVKTKNQAKTIQREVDLFLKYLIEALRFKKKRIFQLDFQMC